MPELPEVETVVRTLRPIIVGRQIGSVELHRNDYATPCGFSWDLTGRRIVDVRRRAKRIILHLCRDEVFLVHLGMTGQLIVVSEEEPVAKHTHAVFTFGDKQLRLCDPRRFGRLDWIGSDLDRIDHNLGPEPLTLSCRDLRLRLAQTARPLKSALLDQTFIAGLGNIYVDESLFAAGLHPLQRCCNVTPDEARRLSRSIKRTLRHAIDAGGSTLRDYVDAVGQRGTAQQAHRVYGRTGQPCRRCRTKVEQFVLSARSTHWCPVCQRLPHAA
jgi:formamidopyrimidine-DNA glycosylase